MHENGTGTWNKEQLVSTLRCTTLQRDRDREPVSPPVNEVAGRQCFQRCVSVYRGVYPSMHVGSDEADRGVWTSGEGEGVDREVWMELC